MRPYVLFLGALFILSCSAGEGQGEKHVYWVNSSMASCIGRAPSKCLQVQQSDTMDPLAWVSFRASIEGFEYEPGYFYKIVIRERKPGTVKPEEHAPSPAYTLVEILEKRPDMKFRINGTWQLLKIREEAVPAQSDQITPPLLEIDVGEMRYRGNDGCNNFNGGFVEITEQKIRFGIAAATRKMCQDMHIPDLLNSTLPEVFRWQIEDNILHLFDADGMELMQLIKSE